MPDDLPEELLSDPIARRAFLLIAAVATGTAVFSDQILNPQRASAAGVTLWPNGSTVAPYITSHFGMRLIGGQWRMHQGTDFVGFDTVRAVSDGHVIRTGYLPGWAGGGNQVYIQHDGYTSRSLHLRDGSIVVAEGQPVTAGTPLGTMGNTGNSFGVHLHLEIDPGGGQVDPVPFIQARLHEHEEEEEDMPSAEEIAAAVWNYSMIGGNDDLVGPETAGERLRAIRRRVQRLYDVMGQTGTFFKHADLNSSNLWIYVLPNGDFVRIRDQHTADLYKERAGGSIPLSAAAIELLVSDLEKAGGRDLASV